MQKRILAAFSPLKYPNDFFISLRTFTLGAGDWEDDPPYVDVPRPPKNKSERKPYPTPMNVLIRRAKEEREARKAQPCRMLEEAPDNGLLVPELVKVAHRVYRARESLLIGLAKLIQYTPLKRCRFCYEVHIGHLGHEIRTCTGSNSGSRNNTHVWISGGVQSAIYFPKCFHLFDRVGKPRVGHKERHSVPRIPAIVELCIQAGLELERYPARRRTKPVYCIDGRIVDFELEAEKDGIKNTLTEDINIAYSDDGITNEDTCKGPDMETILKNLAVSNSWQDGDCLRAVSIRTLDLWLEMISGVKKLMEKYNVITCGYCPEVQVGPKGHKVRMCKASKHQSRDGLHAWQEATIDDIIGPKYVWHVEDPKGTPMANSLKRYYGKAPAAVELCVQAGAPVPDEYKSMMRQNVVSPNRDEADLVA